MNPQDQYGAGERPTDAGDKSTAQQAADTAQAGKETAQAGKEAASAVASTATDQAKNVAAEAGAQARDLLGKTKSELNDQVGTQQVAVVENLRSLGDQLAEMTDHVEHQGTAVDLAAQARDRVRGAADWLDGRDPGDVLDELRKLGRNKPGAFLLGSVVAGVVAGRLTRGVVAEHTDSESTITSPSSHDSSAQHRADELSARPRPAMETHARPDQYAPGGEFAPRGQYTPGGPVPGSGYSGGSGGVQR